MQLLAAGKMTLDRRWNNVIFQRWNNVGMRLVLKVEITSAFQLSNNVVFRLEWRCSKVGTTLFQVGMTSFRCWNNVAFRLEWHCFNIATTLFSGSNDIVSMLIQSCILVGILMLFQLSKTTSFQPQNNIGNSDVVSTLFQCCNPDINSALMYFSSFSVFLCTATTVSISLSEFDRVEPRQVRLWRQYYEWFIE